MCLCTACFLILESVVPKALLLSVLKTLTGHRSSAPKTGLFHFPSAGTASKLAEFGIRSNYPRVSGSEELLNLPFLQSVRGLRILIIRGAGGRELLANKLTLRGAEVSYMEVYRRSPTSQYDRLELPLGSIIVVTSLEALVNLKNKLGERVSLFRIVVVSHRIADEARGFAKTTIAGGASDQALYDAILKALQS